MSFSKQQLRKFADLVRIGATDEELAALNTDVVFEWVNALKDVDTTNVTPMYTPARHSAPRRADVVTDGNMRTAVLANAPDKSGVSRGYFAVPKVMEE
ncbi:Asp-tRNA(Asn)/Glu-tRNA(Gln) amidotransferase subunit GatC [bacterium]|nr:Asp-tRNA(Asn)/Glu-tRNA(Gln) amidotransferase subunit GatC [bacterium]